MASGEEWDSRMMLDLYIHDYMLKKNMHEAAEVFAKEAHVPRNPVVVNAPGGFLNEWWSIFWDVYNSRPNRTEDRAESSVRASMENEMPNFPRDQAMNQQGAGQFPVNPGFNNSQAESEARMLAAHMNDNRTMAPPRAVNSNLQILDGPFLGYPRYCARRLFRVGQNAVELVSGLLLLLTAERKLEVEIYEFCSFIQIGKEVMGLARFYVYEFLAINDGHGVLSGGSIPIDSILHGVPSAIYPRTGLPDAAIQLTGIVVRLQAFGNNKEMNGGRALMAVSGRAAEADKPSDENLEAFLSSDENTADVMSNSFSILQQRSRSSTGNKNEHG
ncbi:hypothetical protein RJ639_005719, partial [Escallonia herrerae]